MLNEFYVYANLDDFHTISIYKYICLVHTIKILKKEDLNRVRGLLGDQTTDVAKWLCHLRKNKRFKLCVPAIMSNDNILNSIR